jgi:hypothetical protein
MTIETKDGDALAQLETIANAVAKLAEAENTRAEADSVRAKVENSRAEAEKVRAETEKVRVETEDARAAAQAKLEADRADLEGKRIANDKARWDAEVARVDKSIERLTGAIPDLASLQKSTVTFTGDAGLRQAEAVGAAMQTAAIAVATKVVAALGAAAPEAEVGTAQTDTATGTPSAAPAARVHVTSNTRLMADIAEYRRLDAEIAVLESGLTNAMADAEALLAESAEHLRFATAAPPAGIIAATVAGQAITQLASLLEVDVAATTFTTEVGALSAHAAVLAEILRQAPGTEVVHESLSTPAATSPLLGRLRNLVTLELRAAVVLARLDRALAALGPAKKDEEPTTTARRQALADSRTALAAISTKARDLLTRITTAPPGEPGSLGTVLAVEALATATAGAEPWVLVLGAAPAEASQIVVTRRLLAPRLQTSASVTVDWFLVRGQFVRAAGRECASVAHHARIQRDGAVWSAQTALPSAAGVSPQAQQGTQPAS